jgi:hypothetical protein
MIHECNRALESVWSTAIAGGPLVVEPQRGVLSYAFLARRWDGEHYAFTHAGAGLSAIHGRRLHDQNLLGLFRRSDRAALREGLEDAVRLSSPLIVRTRGRRIDGGGIEFEGTFWPLQGPRGVVDRVLGALAPCVGVHGDRPVIEHALDEVSLMPRDNADPAPSSGELARLLLTGI